MLTKLSLFVITDLYAMIKLNKLWIFMNMPSRLIQIAQLSLLTVIGILLSYSAQSSHCPETIHAPFSTVQTDQIHALPEYGCVSSLQLSGHLPINNTPCTDLFCSRHDASLFYWFVAGESKHAVQPIILWLNGGPGASSFYGFFSENGPYSVSSEGRLQTRAHSWHKAGHFLMIDNPKGVGFSYTAAGNYANDEQQATIELYNALTAFYQRYPELRANPLYLSGESYAGKYLAYLAARIIKHNEQDKSVPINLQGLIVGDGWVNPLTQQSSVADYAYSHGLIDKNIYQEVQLRYNECAAAITSNSKKANALCMKVNDTVAKASGVDRHDIRTLAEIDYQPIINYLNKDAVRKALHVDPRIKQFRLFNEQVSTHLEQEIQRSAAPIYEQLLAKKLPILIFTGLDDGTDSNFMGADLWLSQLQWQGSKAFSHAPTKQWINKRTGDVAGYIRTAQGLTQIKLRAAGHMAPMDQPENTLDMMINYIHKTKKMLK